MFFLPCKCYQPQVVHRISSIAEFGARLLQCCSLWCCMVKWCSQTGGESIEKVTWRTRRTSFKKRYLSASNHVLNSTRILKWMSDGMNCITPKFLNLDPPTPWDLTGMAPIWVQLSSWHNSVMMPPARRISEFLRCFLVFSCRKNGTKDKDHFDWSAFLLAQSVPGHESFASNIWLERLGRNGRVQYQFYTRWWFQIFFIFTPTWGRFPFWRSYFSDGLKPPTSIDFYRWYG